MADRSQRERATKRKLSLGEKFTRMFSSSGRRLESSSASGIESDVDAQSDQNGYGDSQREPPEAQGSEPKECLVRQEEIERKRSRATCHGCLSSVHEECREIVLLADTFQLKLCKSCGEWLTGHIDAIKEECSEPRKFWGEKRWLSKLFKTVKGGMVFSNSESEVKRDTWFSEKSLR